MRRVVPAFAALCLLLLPGAALAGDGQSSVAQLAARPPAFWVIAAILGAAAWWSMGRRRR